MTLLATAGRKLKLNPQLEGYLRATSESPNMSFEEVVEFLENNNVQIPHNFYPIMPAQLKQVEIMAGNTRQLHFILSYSDKAAKNAVTLSEESPQNYSFTEKEILGSIREVYEMYTNGVIHSGVIRGTTSASYFTIPMLVGIVEGKLTVLKIDASSYE